MADETPKAGYGTDRQEYTKYSLDRDETGLTEQQRSALRLFAAGVTQNDAAAQLGVTKQRMSAIVRNLTERGLVERTGRGKPLRVLGGAAK